MIPKLIMFDGPPGAGKSSLSQFLAGQLEQNNVPVRWVQESALENTFFSRFMESLEQNDGKAVDTLLRCWEDMVEEIAAGETTFIIDGAYFANSTKFLRAANTPPSELERYQRRVDKLLKPISPWLVYLRGDTQRIVRTVIAGRGDNWGAMIAADVQDYPYQQERNRTGIDGMVEFFVDSYIFFENLLQTCPLHAIIIDTTGRDWSTYQSLLLQKVGLQQADTPVSFELESLKEYTGIYRPPDFFPAPYHNPFEVAAMEDGLVLHMYFLRNIALSPLSPTVFALRGHAEQLEFAKDEQGRITGVIYPFVTATKHFCKKVES